MKKTFATLLVFSCFYSKTIAQEFDDKDKKPQMGFLMGMGANLFWNSNLPLVGEISEIPQHPSFPVGVNLTLRAGVQRSSSYHIFSYGLVDNSLNITNAVLLYSGKFFDVYPYLNCVKYLNIGIYSASIGIELRNILEQTNAWGPYSEVQFRNHRVTGEIGVKWESFLRRKR